MKDIPLIAIVCLVASALPAVAQSEWSRVRNLAAGTEIIVTIAGAPPGQRFHVRTDDSQLTALNVTDPTLPRAAVRVLMDMLSHHPDYVASARRTGEFVDRDVRVSPDGVFVADRKVADWDRVVERIAQRDVAEVRIRRSGRGVWGHLGALGGYFVGGLAGGVAGTIACRCDTGGFLVGMVVGGVAGGIHGFRAAARETEDVIYRAP
jgi:hypothetical protein